jgi:hydrogenase maturation protease
MTEQPAQSELSQQPGAAGGLALPKGVLILGIGNILLRDEGIGVRTVEAMAGLDLPDDVELMDGGTSGVDLADELAGRHKLIVIDAVHSEHPAGTVLRFGPEELVSDEHPQMSLHELGLMETLSMARTFGCCPKDVVIFGVQPETTDSGLDMSPTIRGVLPRLIEMVLAEARA